LRHGQGHAADVHERSLHLARLLEDAEADDLRGEAFAVLRAVARADAEKHHDTRFDFGHALVADIDRGRTNPLYDRAQLTDPCGLGGVGAAAPGAQRPRCHSNIHGLSPRTTASTSGPERWPGVNTVMLLPSGRRVM
jgi:hypothetical protein